MKNKSLILSILILSFLVITFFVVNNNIFILDLNNTVRMYIESHQSPFMFKTMLLITQLGNYYEVALIFFVYSLFLFLKNKLNLYIFVLSTFLGTILPLIIKLLTKIPRPSLLLEHDFSFPSSHATIATVFLLSSLFLLSPYLKNKFTKTIFVLITSIVFPLVAFSRIYLSVHWTSDVIAGIILGSICFIFAKIVCCQKKENVI